MICLITPTGDRPDAFALCQQYMLAQDYSGDVRWIIVDDGVTATPVTFEREGWEVDVLRLEPMPRSQARNLLVGMGHVAPGGRVAIIEDDDAYAPEYLSHISDWLDSADLVGERFTRYYNVRTGRGQQMKNRDHASLCATAMKGEATEDFCQLLVKLSSALDMTLWRDFKGSKYLSDTFYVTGIKGMPGRKGVGVGHREEFGLPMSLRHWIGERAALYGY
tara:strand:+ start:24225 stop:24884 length:660 start_codon:yes stop_codon:yes gene_type:complete